MERVPKFFSGTPYYLRHGKSYGFQIWPVHSQGPYELKHIYNFGEKGAWAYPGTAQIFLVLPIIPGTGKATNPAMHRAHRAVSFAMAKLACYPIESE